MTHMLQCVDPDFDQSGYGLIDLGDAPNEQNRERWLFLWVIIQALVDIGMIQPLGQGRHRTGGKNLNQPDRRAAVNWLLYNKRDFFQVCDLAGANAQVIREKAREFICIRRSVGLA